MDRSLKRGEFEFYPTLSWWWGIQVTNCFIFLWILLQQFCKLGVQWYLCISQSVIDMKKVKEVIVDKDVGEINLFHFPKIPLQLCIIVSVQNMCKTKFYRVWKITSKDVHVSLSLKSMSKKWDRFLYMGFLGTKNFFIFSKFILDWSQ